MCARKWQSVERCSFIMKKFKFSTEKKPKRDSLRDPSQIRVDLLVINLFKCLLWETGIYGSFQIVKQRAFERAIASEEKEEAPLTNYENITVNINYRGFASSFLAGFWLIQRPSTQRKLPANSWVYGSAGNHFQSAERASQEIYLPHAHYCAGKVPKAADDDWYFCSRRWVRVKLSYYLFFLQRLFAVNWQFAGTRTDSTTIFAIFSSWMVLLLPRIRICSTVISSTVDHGVLKCSWLSSDGGCTIPSACIWLVEITKQRTWTNFMALKEKSSIKVLNQILLLFNFGPSRSKCFPNIPDALPVAPRRVSYQ